VTIRRLEQTPVFETRSADQSGATPTPRSAVTIEGPYNAVPPGPAGTLAAAARSCPGVAVRAAKELRVRPTSHLGAASKTVWRTDPSAADRYIGPTAAARAAPTARRKRAAEGRARNASAAPTRRRRATRLLNSETAAPWRDPMQAGEAPVGAARTTRRWPGSSWTGNSDGHGRFRRMNCRARHVAEPRTGFDRPAATRVEVERQRRRPRAPRQDRDKSAGKLVQECCVTLVFAKKVACSWRTEF
jgi:hypothetical protein